MVLPAARMGAVHRADGAAVLRVSSDGRGREQTLLRLFVLQRDRSHHTHQAGRRGRGVSRVLSVGIKHYTSQYYVRAKMPRHRIPPRLHRYIQKLSRYNIHSMGREPRSTAGDIGR